MQAVSTVVLYFFLFGICGWVCESIFCSINEKKVVNRGFVSGPICPIYGFGGLIVVYVLAPARENLLVLFLLGMAATTLLEYVTSFVLEKLFQTSWWDYSDLPHNINGRVCLRFSLIFGALSVIAVDLLYPPFEHLVESIPLGVRPWLSLGFVVLFSADCAMTVYGILSLNGKLAELKAISAEIRQRWEEQLAQERTTLTERLEHMRLERAEKNAVSQERFEQHIKQMLRKFQSRRLLRAFPNMKSTKYQEQFAQVKEAFMALRRNNAEKTKKNEKKH